MKESDWSNDATLASVNLSLSSDTKNTTEMVGV
jgi:hypothetical protein